MKQSSNSYAASPLPTLLLVLFIGLKLAGIITWSWWWVMAPMWVPFLLGVLLAGCIAAAEVFANRNK
jgi:uncharacterized protein (DUF983 family)